MKENEEVAFNQEQIARLINLLTNIVTSLFILINDPFGYMEQAIESIPII